MKTFVLYGMVLSTVLIVPSSWAESIYRCPDGTFTNKAERQCPAYEAKAIGRIQARPNSEQQPLASVTVLDEQAKKRSQDRENLTSASIRYNKQKAN